MGIGKLKKTVKHKCPDCGFEKMELRQKEIKYLFDGEEKTYFSDYLVCPVCDYEKEVDPKKNRPW